MQREIIKIDEEKCTGCGECVPKCHEGALQVIDGKVRLVSELMCDGLGACIGHCPENAITIEKREAQPYDEITAPAPVSAIVADTPSQLTHWPVQMHLINPNSPVYRGADLLLAADCVAFSLGSFHQNFLKNRSLAIACPKLDHGTETYIDKIVAMIDIAKVNTITVMMMEVPCCGGLLQMVRSALAKASGKVPVKAVIVGIDGKILKDEWI